MPEVTSIAPQKKRKNRFNVFLDGKYNFAASDEIILKNKLNVGKKLSEKDIEKIIAHETQGKFLELAINFLSFRPRSEKEVEEYLVKKISEKENVKFFEAKESPLVRKLLDKLKRYNYLNDNDFAKWWVESRNRVNPKGKYILSLELRRKGINEEIIKKNLDSSEDELLLARKAISKKEKAWRGLAPDVLKQKVYTFLGSRGFDFATISKIFAYLVKRM